MITANAKNNDICISWDAFKRPSVKIILMPSGIEKMFSTSRMTIRMNITDFKHEYVTFKDVLISAYDPAEY